MWCPSTSLSVWANAWLAGRAAPDDVLDALSAWAPAQSVAAHDAVVASSIGLSWPDACDGGAAALLKLVRGAGPSAAGYGIRPVFPVPGDVRGLPAATTFSQEAILAGEAVLIGSSDSSPPIGLVPAYSEDTEDGYAAELCWTVFPLTSMPPSEQHDLGDAEYTLRSAVRTAAEALGSTGSRWADYGVEDPRLRVEQMMEAALLHRIPDHAPNRAVRVLQSAAHVEAIITVSADLLTASAQTSAAVQRAVDTVAPLTSVVRSARSAAVTEILHSAWRA
ncbi:MULTISPECIES: hypothetical protein [Mycolicibacter]|uniref:hypothetical protein n=1 Tax=Mycolicibacter TaxID=1073531 RepID=UPI0007EFD8EE|nr:MULTISPECIES: hypothetical protein [Mycolicibacter]OBJ28835.1 hypothetical protein A5631_19660 [Mycolicibacter heraklionensis]ULP45707.1 hypothetical protein MJO54_12485 [Mycolicibacter virginiensis]